MQDWFQQLLNGLRATSGLEFIAVCAGIASVWFSRMEHILVYPVGLINTIIYIYLSIQGQLWGEASVNMYYTAVSIYGWLVWARKDAKHQPVLKITRSTQRQWWLQIAFFLSFFLILYLALVYLKKTFAPGAIPWADALASAAAYTGMWLMTRKKRESWIWWIITNICSIPLYFVKGYVFTSFYYLVLLILAVSGWLEWNRKAGENEVYAESGNHRA